MRKRVIASIGVAGLMAAGLGGVALATGARQSATATKAVTLSEFKISKIGSFSSSTTSVTFTLKNGGKFPHDFVVVSGPTKSPAAAAVQLSPGKSKTVTMSLKPGAYLVVCKVGKGYHYSQGMVTTFTVGTFNPSTGTWS